MVVLCNFRRGYEDMLPIFRVSGQPGPGSMTRTRNMLCSTHTILFYVLSYE
jgi:hypothetical protein